VRFQFVVLGGETFVDIENILVKWFKDGFEYLMNSIFIVGIVIIVGRFLIGLGINSGIPRI
jgi:hypothetical protein